MIELADDSDLPAMFPGGKLPPGQRLAPEDAARRCIHVVRCPGYAVNGNIARCHPTAEPGGYDVLLGGFGLNETPLTLDAANDLVRYMAAWIGLVIQRDRLGSLEEMEEPPLVYTAEMFDNHGAPGPLELAKLKLLVEHGGRLVFARNHATGRRFDIDGAPSLPSTGWDVIVYFERLGWLVREPGTPIETGPRVITDRGRVAVAKPQILPLVDISADGAQVGPMSKPAPFLLGARVRYVGAGLSWPTTGLELNPGDIGCCIELRAPEEATGRVIDAEDGIVDKGRAGRSVIVFANGVRRSVPGGFVDGYELVRLVRAQMPRTSGVWAAEVFPGGDIQVTCDGAPVLGFTWHPAAENGPDVGAGWLKAPWPVPSSALFYAADALGDALRDQIALNEHLDRLRVPEIVVVVSGIAARVTWKDHTMVVLTREARRILAELTPEGLDAVPDFKRALVVTQALGVQTTALPDLFEIANPRSARTDLFWVGADGGVWALPYPEATLTTEPVRAPCLPPGATPTTFKRHPYLHAIASHKVFAS